MNSQESIGPIGWDYLDTYPQVNTITRIYIFFALIAFAVAVVRLIRLWIAAPPFCLKRKIRDRAYLKRLERWRSSTRQWTGCAILGWALVISSDLYAFGMRLGESKFPITGLLISQVRNIGASSVFAAFMCLLLFFTQWHMLIRIQRLRVYATVRESAD